MKELEALKIKMNAYKNEQLELFKIPLIRYSIPQIDAHNYIQMIDYDKDYYLITITIDSKIHVNLDETGQYIKLDNCLKELGHKHQYFSCFEKHKSGILHSHIMLCITDHHLLLKYLMAMKKHITKSLKLHPSIKYDIITKNQKSYNATFTYIIIDKTDHPNYKKLFFMLNRKLN